MQQSGIRDLAISIVLFMIGIAVLLLTQWDIFQIGYDLSTISSATWLSLKLLGSALLWTFLIQSSAISLCFISARWQKEMGQILEIVFQLLSSLPLFVICLYFQQYHIQNNMILAGTILAIGDFLLATLFPMLRWNLLRYFRPPYREALQGRGIYFPGFSLSKERWIVFYRYYIVPYLSEFLRILQSKIPLFFSALIVVEKALFYGTSIEGANRGLGSIFFDCVLEWSEGKTRGIILLTLSLWCLTLVTLIRILLIVANKKFFPAMHDKNSENVTVFEQIG